MIDVIKAKERHFTDFGWLKTYWLLSFSNYFLLPLHLSDDLTRNPKVRGSNPLGRTRKSQGLRILRSPFFFLGEKISHVPQTILTPQEQSFFKISTFQ